MPDEGDRLLLCVGLLLVVAGVSEVRGSVGVRSVRGVVHHPVYRSQHAVHGARPPRHGQRHGEGAQKWQLCEYHAYMSPVYFYKLTESIKLSSILVKDEQSLIIRLFSVFHCYIRNRSHVEISSYEPKVLLPRRMEHI